MDNLADYNNNPGNLKPPKGVKYEGQIGVDDRGFAIFENKSFGQRALVNDINIKINRGLDTPEKFIDRYAPAGEENPEDARENYKIKLAASLGLKSTNDPFPKGAAPKIADVIYRFESGTEPKQEEMRRSEQDTPKHFELETTGLKKEPVSFSDQAGELMRMAMEADPYRVAGDVAAAYAGAKTPAKVQSFLQGYQGVPSNVPGVMGGALPTATPTAPPGAGPVTRNVPGSSGAANWTRAMGQNIPDVLAESAESMRKTDPRGGQAIIDRDIANMQKIRGMGAGNFQLSGSGPNQLMLPPEVAANRPPPPPPPQPKGPGVLPRIQSGLRQAFPIGKTSALGALGGLGMAEGARETGRRLQEDDMLGALLAGLGTVGSAGAMTPFPPARIAGTVAATASPLALYLYDKMRSKQTGSMPLPAVYARYQR